VNCCSSPWGMSWIGVYWVTGPCSGAPSIYPKGSWKPEREPLLEKSAEGQCGDVRQSDGVERHAAAPSISVYVSTQWLQPLYLRTPIPVDVDLSKHNNNPHRSDLGALQRILTGLCGLLFVRGTPSVRSLTYKLGGDLGLDLPGRPVLLDGHVEDPGDTLGWQRLAEL
jgi:hypothetical protein